MALVELITPNNVVKAVQFILKIDQSYIDAKHWPDLSSAIYWLKDSLDNYLHPSAKLWPNGMSHIEHLEISLRTLLDAVKSLLPCLNEEAQMQLRQFLLAASPVAALA